MATWIAVAGEKLFFLQYNFPTIAQSYAHPSPTVRTNSVAHQTIQCIHIFYPRPRLCIADFFLFAHCQQQFFNGSSRDTSNQNKFKILKKITMLHSKTVSVIHISDSSSWLIDWCPSSFEKRMPLGYDTLVSLHNIIPMVLLLVTAGLLPKAYFTNIFSLGSPLAQTIQREDHADKRQLLERYSKHEHFVKFTVDDMSFQRGSTNAQNSVVFAH